MMKSVQLPSLNLTSTTGFVAIGAASGAIAGFAGLMAYSLLAGKGATAGWALKTVTAGSGTGWMNLLIPTSAGAVGGGASGFGVAKQAVSQRVQEASEQFEAEAGELRQQVRTLEARLEAKQATAINASDLKLERIKGIGPKFAQLLQGAGIHNLDDLAQASPDELRQLLESSSVGQMANLESWISQAKELALQTQY